MDEATLFIHVFGKWVDLIVRHSKPGHTPHYQAQQTSPCAPLSFTANLNPRPIVRHSKSSPVPQWQAQPTSLCAPPSGTTNLVPRQTATHFKPRTTSHYQTQQTSPHATLLGHDIIQRQITRKLYTRG